MKKDDAFAYEAFKCLSEMMANSHNDILEDMNKVNKGEVFVLHYLSQRQEPTLPSNLSNALKSSSARISALLSKLEKRGFVTRDIDVNNRRNILVSVTKEGKEYIEGLMSEVESNMVKVFIEMGEKDTLEYVRLTKLFFDISKKNLNSQDK